MNNKKTRLQRFISSSIAVLLFAAITLGRGTACGSIDSRELYGGLCQNPNRQSSR